MSFRGGGRSFGNNRFVNPHNSGPPRSSVNSRGQPDNPRGGFHNNIFRGGRGGRQGNSFRQQVSKPKICFLYQQSGCGNPNCPDMHQYSFNNEIGRLQIISAPSSIFAACLITESQISVALSGKIAIYDIKTGSLLVEFQISGRTKSLVYTDAFGPSVLLFCGDTGNRQLLGAISLTGEIVSFKQVHGSGVNVMLCRRGLIFAGGDDAKVSVWYFTGQSFELGMLMEMHASVQSQIICLELVQSTLIAGLANGLVVGWDYNFESNQYVWKGNLNLVHQGRVTALEVYEDNFIFSAGEDGIINYWDAAAGFTGGALLNATKAKPVQISQMRLCETPSGTSLLVGTTQGKVLWYMLQQSDAKFLQPLSYHKKCITSILNFNGLEGYNGFITTSIDNFIIISNWNMGS